MGIRQGWDKGVRGNYMGQADVPVWSESNKGFPEGAKPSDPHQPWTDGWSYSSSLRFLPLSLEHGRLLSLSSSVTQELCVLSSGREGVHGCSQQR